MELRILRKKYKNTGYDEEVLQYLVEESYEIIPGSLATAIRCVWKDVPVVEETPTSDRFQGNDDN